MGRTTTDNRAKRRVLEILTNTKKLRDRHASLMQDLEERLALEASFPNTVGAGRVATRIVATPHDMEKSRMYSGKKDSLRNILFYADAADGTPLVRCLLANMPEPYRAVTLRKLRIRCK